MISAFGIIHKADEPPVESNRARRRRIAEEKAQGITGQTKQAPAKPAKPAAPKPETPKAEAPKPEAPKVEAPKPEAAPPGGTMGKGPQEAAVAPDAPKEKMTPYQIGQKRAFREGKGPIESAMRGVGYTLKAHPGKTAGAAAGGAAAVVGTGAYMAGRKKRDS